MSLPFEPIFTAHYFSSLRQAMIEEFDLDMDNEISEAEFFAIMTDHQ